jgi:serine/threonine protein kinase
MKEWLRAGTKIAHFRVSSRLGASGVGEVYLAQDVSSGRSLALKLLPEALVSDQRARQRFAQIYTQVAQLRHPNFCTVYESGVTDAGRPFVAMEYFYGHSFDLFGFGVQLSIPQIVFLIVQIAEALDSVHARGWHHLAIKPANLMIVSKQAKILDLGFAAAFPLLLSDNAPEPMKVTLSDARYLSPEQIMGERPDQRADVFSLGAVFYELLAGRPPFAGYSVNEVIATITLAEPDPVTEFRDDAPAELDAILARAMAKNIMARYQTMGEFALGLRNLAAQQPKWPPLPPPDLSRSIQRSGRNGGKETMANARITGKLGQWSEGGDTPPSLIDDLKQLFTGRLRNK